MALPLSVFCLPALRRPGPPSPSAPSKYYVAAACPVLIFFVWVSLWVSGLGSWVLGRVFCSLGRPDRQKKVICRKPKAEKEEKLSSVFPCTLRNGPRSIPSTRETGRSHALAFFPFYTLSSSPHLHTDGVGDARGSGRPSFLQKAPFALYVCTSVSLSCEQRSSADIISWPCS